MTSLRKLSSAGALTLMGRLEGKIALVTGGGSGIGRAAAKRFAREGARVAIVGRTLRPLEETARAIQKEGGTVVAISADLSRHGEVRRVMRRVEREMGPLQVLFNNHGIFEPARWKALRKGYGIGSWM
jgi:NAD(P)-dependent dehydrogenase (short-subunit alcohol dehydrogenase family)